MSANYFIEKLMKNTNDNEEFDKVCLDIPNEEWFDIMCEYRKRMHKKNKRYYYLITFTLRPDIEEKEEKNIFQYIISQFEDRPPLQISEAYIVQERTKSDRAHWHVAVSSKVTLSKNMFHYYSSKYGFVDISKSRNNTLEESLKYISKDGTPTKLAIREI